MEKINLKEFLNNNHVVLSYCINHMINEDWKKLDGSEISSEVFDTMQFFITATQKCLEYHEILKEYRYNHNDCDDFEECVFYL